MDSQRVELKEVQRKLDALRTVFANAAVGDFSTPIEIPNEDNEFTDLYMGANIMMEVIHTQLEELRKHSERADALNKTKSEFVALVSHQLRTPLTHIKWSAAKLASIAGDALSPDQKKAIVTIVEASEQMNTLVTNILDSSRIELGTLVMNIQDISVAEEVQSVLHELAPQAEIKKIIFTETYGERCIMSADRALVHIILHNLLSNAVKYSPSGGTVRITVECKNKRILIQVSDTGLGISLDDQPHIFEKLFRASSALVSDTQGVGLGLYMVKSVVTKTGGDIWFTSVEGVGTTFFVSYPLEGMKKVSLETVQS